MYSVFHTADWHLGQTFLGFDRDFEHQQFLEWLLNALQQHRPDAMIIAGDVFDTVNPSALAQRRLYDFLARVSASLPSLQMVMTAGNHDSGSRLEAPAGLMESLKIHVVGTVRRGEDDRIDPSRFLIALRDVSGRPQAIVLAIPFLRPSDVPLIPDAQNPYLDGIAEVYRIATQWAVELRSQLGEDMPIIAMGHCHVMGGIESRESERRIVIGGAESLRLDVFPADLTYVALGHLHKAQQFEDGRVCYSGSPIPLSFSEAGYRHRLLKLQFDGSQLMSVEDVPVPRTVPLISVPKDGSATIDEVLQQIRMLSITDESEPDRHPFLEVRIVDDGPDPTRRKRVEDAVAQLPVRLASIKIEAAVRIGVTQSVLDELVTLSDLQSINPEDIFCSNFRDLYDRDPDEALLKAFREIVAQQQEAGGT